MTHSLILERMQAHGITLPPPAPAVGAYVPFVISGNQLFISGQLPLRDGKPSYIGKVGQELTVEDGYNAARLCALNILAQASFALDDDLGRVLRVVKLGGFVNATPTLGQEPAVINGASELMVQMFEERGRHARFAVGVQSLPFRVSVEVEALFEIDI